MTSPEPRARRESYSNFGGINQKASFYLTDDNDCLDLLNYSFIQPGSLTSMPGSTYYVGATVPGRISGLYEYEKLSGFSQIIYTANNIMYSLSNGIVAPIRIGITPNALWDFVTFTDTLFATNGAEFLKYDGTNISRYSSPDGTTLSSGLGVAAAGFSGIFQFAYGYLTTTGYYTGVGARATFTTSGTQAILSGFTFPSDFGVTAGVLWATTASGQDLGIISYLPTNTATFTVSGISFISTLTEPDSSYFTLAPRYLELFQNSLFLIGSSQFPSSAFYTELGDPEAIYPDQNFEVRTNDGDVLTGGKFYNNAIYLFKNNSFSKVQGNDTTNFSLFDVSDQYGSLSNRAVVVYNDTMLFLDKKGIARYDGATPEIISNKLENTFLSMNLSAASDNANAVHFKLRNEIWWGIPTDGATVNNTIIVYDYLANAFTVRKGFLPSSMQMIQGSFGRETAFYGGYSGSIHYVGSTLYNDNGVGMTQSMQSKFYNIFGPSVTGQYRRLWIDCDPIVGFTVPMTINFRKDEQDAIVLTRTIYLDQFQTRIDFGIPAKSLSVELITSGASFPVKLNGFTLEGRVQRKV